MQQQIHSGGGDEVKKHWMKFYPSDWRADPQLRMCSIGARGLWTEMICLMHEAEPYGSLLVNGNSVSEKQLAALAGVTPKEAATYIVELECAGVFSRDNGVIYSRRMKRDHERSEEGRTQVEKRWGNREPNGSPIRVATETPITPDTRDQNPERLSSFRKVGEVKRSGYSPPKHGAYHKQKALVYFLKGTSEWDAHAADYAAVHFEEPKPDKGGGYWFKMKGEAA